MTKTMAEAEKEAKLLASALGATYELAIMGFARSPYIRLVFTQDDGARFHFDMPTEGPHWNALVRLASKQQRIATMTTPPPAPIYPAELLKDLVERFLAGSLWTREQRKDAWLLVSLLCDYSRDLERERKLWDDTDAVEALGASPGADDGSAGTSGPPDGRGPFLNVSKGNQP